MYRCKSSNGGVASVLVNKKDFSLKKVVVKGKDQDIVIREGRKIGDGLWQVSFSATEIVEVEDDAGRSWGFDFSDRAFRLLETLHCI